MKTCLAITIDKLMSGSSLEGKPFLRNDKTLNSKAFYRIAGKFGRDLNLAVWQSGLKPFLRNHKTLNSKAFYRIAGKFGRDLNLVVWRSGLKRPN